eukprot:gnl/MRDRNA2_/MRDRNA2_297766_c0_seq1.p1 gnl/MRDRNA2_/MRDRNA2_297766_c0~~gnl/MRDRNA2_/MRDRNA2_297766_c0_seq1.p1  ORF type:complete len:365 (+),score=81.04 gnl/MRDRNA2_/MRDRNA2_297766_c0_seq1:66-1097(+)
MPESVRTLIRTLRTQCQNGDLVPAKYLASIIHACTIKLAPAPRELAFVLEVSLPPALETLELSDLVMIIPSLPRVPHLRAKGGFNTAVFSRVLDVLNTFQNDALVTVIQAAWQLRYTDVNFWNSCFRRCEHFLENHAWSGEHISGVALVAASLIREERQPKPQEVSAPEVSLLSSGDAADNSAGPAAERLLGVIVQAAIAQAGSLSMRALANLAVAYSRADHWDSHLFALISHGALEHFQAAEEGNGVAPNGKDVAQLLSAFAHFDLHDEDLLRAVASRAHVDFGKYDERTKDITLWALARLEAPGQLRDEVLERELQKGFAAAGTLAESHLAAVAVKPVRSA